MEFFYKREQPDLLMCVHCCPLSCITIRTLSVVARCVVFCSVFDCLTKNSPQKKTMLFLIALVLRNATVPQTINVNNIFECYIIIIKKAVHGPQDNF